MGTLLKIVLVVTVVSALLAARFFWIFFGNPYPRLSLVGTAYIADDDALKIVGAHHHTQLFLIKKYKYSKQATSFGFGGASSYVTDYYGVGVADADKRTLIPPKYHIIGVRSETTTDTTGQKAQIPMILAIPYPKTGNEKKALFHLKDGKAVLVKTEGL